MRANQWEDGKLDNMSADAHKYYEHAHAPPAFTPHTHTEADKHRRPARQARCDVVFRGEAATITATRRHECGCTYARTRTKKQAKGLHDGDVMPKEAGTPAHTQREPARNYGNVERGEIKNQSRNDIPPHRAMNKVRVGVRACVRAWVRVPCMRVGARNMACLWLTLCVWVPMPLSLSLSRCHRRHCVSRPLARHLGCRKIDSSSTRHPHSWHSIKMRTMSLDSHHNWPQWYWPLELEISEGAIVLANY